MTSQVFISYSSKDKAIADTICQWLESAGIPCWMAPRDIEIGSDWTEAIMRAITACRVFVLVFSENANVSGHVRREVAKAFESDPRINYPPLLPLKNPSLRSSVMFTTSSSV
jgi:TIR domain